MTDPKHFVSQTPAAQPSEELLAEARACRDPLIRAQRLLAIHQGRKEADRAAFQDLHDAHAVFAANGHHQAQVRTIFMMVQVLRVLGAAQSAAALIGRVLQTMRLTMEDRAGLAHQGLHALTQMLRYDEAEDHAQRYLVPALHRGHGTAARLPWWLSLAYLRVHQHARAAVHCNVVCLDLPPGQAADDALARHRLDQAQHCLQAARALAGAAAEHQMLDLLELVLIGCRGDVDQAQRRFDTLNSQWAQGPAPLRLGLLVNHGLVLQCNDRPQQAYAVLLQAATLARETEAHGPLHMASYSLARLAQDRGDASASMRHYDEFVRLHAERRRQQEDSFTLVEDPAAAPTPPGQLHAAQPPYLRRALQLLESRLSDPPRMQVLADSVGVTTRGLEKAMKRYVGQTPVAYVRQRRMRAAAELLCSTPRAVGEVAAELGYSRLSSFTRDFRKVYGVTPQAARSDGLAPPALNNV